MGRREACEGAHVAYQARALLASARRAASAGRPPGVRGRGGAHLELVDLVHAHVAPLADLHVLGVRDAAAAQRVVEARKDVLGKIDALRRREGRWRAVGGAGR